MQEIKERASTITPEMIDEQVRIHNGLNYSKPISLTTSHIGRKFGSLYKTKKKGAYKGTGKSR